MKERIKKLWRREEEVATCKLCTTRLEEGELTCPNCGYLVDTESNVFLIQEDDQGREQEEAVVQETYDPDVEDGGEPELGVAVEKNLDEEIEAVMDGQKKRETNTPVFSLGPAGLRELLAKQPEMLEPGLGVVTDKGGQPVGAGLSTQVGIIDLLARDGSGALVVVMVAERGQGEELVGETLQRIGWVRKNLGKGKQRVRGIVLVEEAPENLSYAAAAVAETILFKAYRVGVTFQDLEV
ncbi:MAG: hypothetical protein ACE5JQ_01620 [Candidatus Methylomirabilales bacterium]